MDPIGLPNAVEFDAAVDEILSTSDTKLNNYDSIQKETYSNNKNIIYPNVTLSLENKEISTSGEILNTISQLLDAENTSQEIQEKRLQALKEKYQLLSPDQFGLKPEELSKLCDFDNRTNPAQVRMLQTQYAGMEGVAFLLKSDLETGLQLKSSFEGNSDDEKLEESLKAMKNQNSLRDRFKLEKRSDRKSMTNLASKYNLNSVRDEKTTSKNAMDVVDAANRKMVYGENIIPPPKSKTIFEIVWDTIKDDPIIKVLLIGAVVVISLGSAICPANGFIEGLAILVAVVIVLSVTAGNDWSKDKKFKKLLLLQSDKKTRVIRGGIKDQISSWDLVVGDLVEVLVGDEIPSDGILVSGNRLVVDESPLTGEAIPVKKGPNAPFLFSGTQVSEGSGTYMVTAVGNRSSGGQIQELLNEAQDEETVLQLKLKVVAVLIGKVGVAAGIFTFIGLVIRWAIDWANGVTPHASTCPTYDTGGTVNTTLVRLQQLAEHFVIGITVVVVAVPEGLPLAVTISLAFSMFKMIRDKCFVRHLSASETMGEATCICTDKTGTLTENRMTVVKTMVGNSIFNGVGSGEPDAQAFTHETMDKRIAELIGEGISVNSSCFIKMREKDSQPIFVGSATEGALLIFAKLLGVKYEEVRESINKVENGVWSFSSDRKRMSTLIKPIAMAPGKPTKYRLYTKGASEIVLGLCTHIIDKNGTAISPLTSSIVYKIQQTIKDWASEGLRTLALAYKDTDHLITTLEGQGYRDDPEHDLIFISLVGIKDPLRKEVPGAVVRCKRAGLTIRMVTGDNVLTANKIARECGILTDGISMEGPVFRDLSPDERKEIVPKLQVLARSSPADKHILVKLLKEMGEVVAVTGDGTNDAPALKEADVGFAMGISGTQIAMNASDIVLLDDNFVSLVQSIKWGRNVLTCVRKFLQFQLGVNLVAITVTFVGSMTHGESPLSTVQLLWVNLIMDSLGALALASDEPDEDILERPPHSRKEHLLSPRMFEYIFTEMMYQTSVLLIILIGGMADTHLLPYDVYSAPKENSATYSEWARSRTKTLVFTTFILMQISNETMARQLQGELNPFKGIFRNKLFVLIMLIIIIIQVLVVTFGSSFVQTVALDWQGWVLSIVIAACNFLWVFIVRVISKLSRGELFKNNSRKISVDTGDVGMNAKGENYDKVGGGFLKPTSTISKTAPLTILTERTSKSDSTESTGKEVEEYEINDERHGSQHEKETYDKQEKAASDYVEFDGDSIKARHGSQCGEGSTDDGEPDYELVSKIEENKFTKDDRRIVSELRKVVFAMLKQIATLLKKTEKKEKGARVIERDKSRILIVISVYFILKMFISPLIYVDGSLHIGGNLADALLEYVEPYIERTLSFLDPRRNSNIPPSLAAYLTYTIDALLAPLPSSSTSLRAPVFESAAVLLPSLS
ncbi:Calcium-transporting ATPase 10, plasma membrane-type [Nowakowskiella sp. JEL0407]|nr:Calcium-transporting ATPase 10, plasma membrane-type [Nowakowskiella sp. JEL0407]